MPTVTTRSLDADMTTRSLDADMTTRSLDADMTTRSLDADMTTRSLDADVTTRNTDSARPRQGSSFAPIKSGRHAQVMGILSAVECSHGEDISGCTVCLVGSEYEKALFS
ncbi:hypothetical protein MAPG_10736 [Magnaporthiopsis poae ATCC 64411]|uniref:Uncharacterized protein n=1 Tax=Magnaporthiopsis poae (strain ATCC 64411 / 73-15) TaxID=644358 RepID=A0A0C4EDD8_MAGP6|nr:hypothetical protein MAPG_10736 [Magnaporthiopsis poae ATCC 64411]